MMPKMPVNHREVMCEDEQQVSAKERSGQTFSYFARKEHQLSTPPALKSDTTCSQFKLLPGYLIKHSWDTAVLPEAHPVQLSSSHSSFLHGKWNHQQWTLQFILSFCTIILLRPGTLHTPQVRRSLLMCHHHGSNVQVSRRTPITNFLFWDVTP